MNADNLSTYDKLMDGGFGFGTICLPTYLPRLLFTIIFPPIAITMEQFANGFKQPTKIITSIILTAMFYFPGLIHGLYGLDCSNMR